MATPRLFRVILPVRDVERAADFYARILDAAGERVSPGRHYFRCGGVILACYDPAADGDERGENWRYHENQYLYIAVADLESMRSRVESAGGTVATEPEVMPWGERLFYALDPLGSRLCFVEEGTVFTGQADGS